METLQSVAGSAVEEKTEARCRQENDVKSDKRGLPQEPAWVRDPKSARLVKLTGKHPRDAAAEEEAQDDEMHARGDVDPSYVALISVESPPFYDSVTGKLLDTELVLKGMMKEHESLESFGTYA